MKPLRDNGLKMLVAILVCVLGALSCSRFEPAAPEDDNVKNKLGGPHMVAPTVHYMLRSSQFDSLLETYITPNIADGDTVILAANTTFVLDGNTPLAGTDDTYYILSASVVFLGESGGDRPVVTTDDDGSGVALLWIQDNTNSGDGGNKDCEIKNIDFGVNAGYPKTSYLVVNKLRTLNIVDVGFEMDDEEQQFRADNVTLERCTIESMATSPLRLLNRVATSFDHLIKDCTISSVASSGDRNCVYTSYDRDSGSESFLEFNGSSFSMSTSGSKYFLLSRLANTFGNDVNLRLLNNEFNDTRLVIDDAFGTTVTYNILYTDNNSDVELCPENLFSQTGSDVDPVWTIHDYTKEDSTFTYDSEITDRKACVSYDVAYVAFLVEDDVGSYNYKYEFSPQVSYGATSCTSGPITAWRNATTGYYNASFDVSGISGGTFKWKPSVSFCANTVTDLCRTVTKHPCPSNPPDWFETPGEESAAGGGGGAEPDSTADLGRPK
jgi:hypothetical protein